MNRLKVAQNNIKFAFKKSIYCLGFVVLLCFFTTIATFAQMGSSMTYSDAWVDASDLNNVRVIGSGVRQDNYNTYSHTYWNVTEMVSPQGRSIQTTSYTSNSYYAYVRSEVSLPFDPYSSEPDVGDYIVRNFFWMRCPYMGGSFFNTDGLPINVSVPRSAFRLTQELPDQCFYAATCNGQCRTDRFSAQKRVFQVPVEGPCPGPFLNCTNIVVRTPTGSVCLVAELFCFGQRNMATCD